MKSKRIAIASVLSALYVVATVFLAPFSFEVIQCRVADAFYPVIGLLGWPALIGLTIGQLLANTISPLGVIDMLSPLMFLPAKYAIKRFGFKAVPFHVLSVALWVAFMLHLAYGLPYWITVLYVGVGETIAELGLGRLLYLGLRGRV